MTARCRMWRRDGKTTEDGQSFVRTRIDDEEYTDFRETRLFDQRCPLCAVRVRISTGVVLEEIEAVHCDDKVLLPGQPLANLADEFFVLKKNLRGGFDVELKAKPALFGPQSHSQRPVANLQSHVFQRHEREDVRHPRSGR
ncbi:hypothetical protein CEXT_107821 [Caerostris extrusa]|uniref:Uncharacterized protein n=1 Tax=Caerostris extrusa TaxID=172846 RepID=A0AAV4PSJ0_CAEEX|nr:hypothetical protein CEXT_107821 [Caerostris extrusa]